MDAILATCACVGCDNTYINKDTYFFFYCFTLTAIRYVFLKTGRSQVWSYLNVTKQNGINNVWFARSFGAEASFILRIMLRILLCHYPQTIGWTLNHSVKTQEVNSIKTLHLSGRRPFLLSWIATKPSLSLFKHVNLVLNLKTLDVSMAMLSHSRGC